jgi:ADP-heptose:LPS heptosyltransferase
MLDVRLMRRLDAVAGNLACSAFAFHKRITSPFQKSQRPVRKIVVMKFFGMGSIVVASPSLRALRDQFPGAEIHFVTFSSNRALLELLNLSDTNYYVDPSSAQTFAKSTLAVAAELRRADCDLVIDLEFFAKFPLVLSSLAGIPKKAGFYLTAESWRRTLLDVTGSYNHYFHTKDIFLSLVYLLATDDAYYLDFDKFSEKYSYPRVQPSQNERSAVRQRLSSLGVRSTQPFFVLNPNTSPDLAPEARKWPKERYAQLARTLLTENPGAACVLIGSPAERDYIESVRQEIADERAITTAGLLNLKELVTLFSEAALVISNDSGPMHLACLVDAPTVGLFFADSPTLFAPVGTHTACVAPKLYSIPLFTVYNGKDVVGSPSHSVKNAAARSVSLDDVLVVVRPMLATSMSHHVEKMN